MYMVKMRMGGNLGLVHLHVRDRDGKKGASRLQSDVLDVVLEASSTCWPAICLDHLADVQRRTRQHQAVTAFPKEGAVDSGRLYLSHLVTSQQCLKLQGWPASLFASMV